MAKPRAFRGPPFQPECGCATDVTPAEWGRTFPEKRWVNDYAVALLG